MEGHILLVEGERTAKTSCAPVLEKQGFQVYRVHTLRATSLALETDPPDLLVIDTRCLRFNGLRLCEALSANEPPIPILLIIPEGQKRPHYPGVSVLRGTPTARKLLNRVKRLLSPPGNHLLRAGELTLDLQRRVLIRKGDEHRLTPRQARLLEVFMRNPGRVLTRAFLMKEVWETDYLDDTRTLEVHVHWLRKAIEEDPRRPRCLTTVRKVGYCFHPSRSPGVRPQPDASQEVEHRQTR
ncbi:MAG: response regulator transcription factor [Chloroflexi bacterium]|jgi:DNA-binding response OmpR family regulator|nr:response regulator transcription factor [Chloroflexota bacterium]